MADTARLGLAEALESGLHKQRYTVVAQPQPLGENSVKRVVQVVATDIELASNALGDFKETLQVWVLTPKTVQPDAENDLEKARADVINILDSLTWVGWNKATRAVHPSGFDAWRFDVTAYTAKEN